MGVFNARGEAMHHAPPWDHVPFLMNDLFSWLKRSKDIPLIKSCVFHFAFETVHPFPDGNGRMGRLWQTAILGRWNPLFYAAPVENMVFSHQQQYYRALHTAQVSGDAGVFIDFMLTVILRTIKAKGVPSGGKKKVVRKGGKKTTRSGHPKDRSGKRNIRIVLHNIISMFCLNPAHRLIRPSAWFTRPWRMVWQNPLCAHFQNVNRRENSTAWDKTRLLYIS